jgi:hypothetical protein
MESKRSNSVAGMLLVAAVARDIVILTPPFVNIKGWGGLIVNTRNTHNSRNTRDILPGMFPPYTQYTGGSHELHV